MGKNERKEREEVIREGHEKGRKEGRRTGRRFRYLYSIVLKVPTNCKVRYLVTSC